MSKYSSAMLAKKLNMPNDKEFKIHRTGAIETNNTYKFTTKGLMVKHRDKGMWWEAFPQIIRQLNEGSAIVIKH